MQRPGGSSGCPLIYIKGQPSGGRVSSMLQCSKYREAPSSQMVSATPFRRMSNCGGIRGAMLDHGQIERGNSSILIRIDWVRRRPSIGVLNAAAHRYAALTGRVTPA